MTELTQVPPFKIDVSRLYRNKTGYDSGYKLNTSFRTEDHTPESLIETVIKQGFPYTMSHDKRSPRATGADKRGCTTPKHTENFRSMQLVTFDDDGENNGVVDFWLNDPFFSKFGWAFVESASSTPAEQKGHPTFLFDRPVTDPALYKEILQAFCTAYPRLDWLINIDRTIYNGEGATVHNVGHTCPLDTFVEQIVLPYRKSEAEKQAVVDKARAERQAAREKAKANGVVVKSGFVEATLRGLLTWMFDKVANTGVGGKPSRNISIYWAGRWVAGAESSPWTAPHAHLFADVEQRIVAAASANGYLSDYANDDPNEVLRVFDRGRVKGGEELEEPIPTRFEVEQPPTDLTQEAPPVEGDDAQDGVDVDDDGGILITGRFLPAIAAEAWAAIKKANNPPSLFKFGGLPVRIESDDGRPITRTLTDDRMRYTLARVATWQKQLKSGTIKPAIPPVWLVKDILATPDLPFPELDAIVSAPVFSPDGTLETAPGYHAAARVFYKPANGDTIPDVSKTPTPQDVDRARNLILSDLLGDFPFTGDAEKAHAVALLLLPFVRPMIDGPTPLHVIEKPTPGTGASLLVDVLLYPATGRPSTTMTEARAESEWRKRLTALLLSSPPVVFIDNLRRRLDSSALAAAITAPVWADRILGKSETVHVPVRCAWVATGNNPALSNEMVRRSVRIRLDAKQDRPWLREGFKHANLGEWCKENRADLVQAALTLVQNWVAQGRPKPGRVLGMFQSWVDVIGGILQAGGIPGFLDNLSVFYDLADEQGATWRAFIALWWGKFGAKKVGVAQLYAMVENSDVHLSELDADTARGKKTQLGILLRGQRDRQYTIDLGDDDAPQVETLTVTNAGKQKRTQVYTLTLQKGVPSVHSVPLTYGLDKKFEKKTRDIKNIPGGSGESTPGAPGTPPNLDPEAHPLPIDW